MGERNGSKKNPNGVFQSARVPMTNPTPAHSPFTFTLPHLNITSNSAPNYSNQFASMSRRHSMPKCQKRPPADVAFADPTLSLSLLPKRWAYEPIKSHTGAMVKASQKHFHFSPHCIPSDQGFRTLRWSFCCSCYFRPPPPTNPLKKYGIIPNRVVPAALAANLPV